LKNIPIPISRHHRNDLVDNHVDWSGVGIKSKVRKPTLRSMCMSGQQPRQHGLTRRRTHRTTVSRMIGTGTILSTLTSPPHRSLWVFTLMSLHIIMMTTVTMLRNNSHFAFPAVAMALTPPRLLIQKTKSGETRYFTEECIIPPLQPLEEESYDGITTRLLHSTRIQLGPLPVVYTNDPKTVEQWLSEHVSSLEGGEGSTIGFDLEVSHPLNHFFSFGNPASLLAS